MKEIKLNRGRTTQVDDADFYAANQFTWFVTKIGNVFYAVRNLPGGGTQMLHCFLFPEWALVDHKDGDGLNNQRVNLRPGDKSKNGANSRKRLGTSSRFKGVTWDKRCNCWHASITVYYNRLFLGRYESEEDAAHVYDYAAQSYFGEFARTNF